MNKSTWIVALSLGFIAWILMVTNFVIPFGNFSTSNGVPFFISPAEIPLVLGPALAGPPGIAASILALFLFLAKGDFGRLIATSLNHVVGGIWLVFAYRFSFQRIKMPLRLVAWMVILVIYFLMMIILFPLFNPGQFHFSLAGVLGFIQVAWLPSLYELLGTLIITSMILFALPEKYRKPLWIKSKSRLEK